MERNHRPHWSHNQIKRCIGQATGTPESPRVGPSAAHEDIGEGRTIAGHHNQTGNHDMSSRLRQIRACLSWPTEFARAELSKSTTDVMIAGLIVMPGDGAPLTKYLVRALGPTLGDSGVPGALANPTLDLVTLQGGRVIRSNDDWKDSTRRD